MKWDELSHLEVLCELPQLGGACELPRPNTATAHLDDLNQAGRDWALE